MWKLPLFNARSPKEVLAEVDECRVDYRDCFI
ncbi:MAG: ribulose bisphosphate carboxylase small subunit, partial [Merismopedia sp. SIO2A8]|nr:ribulose bisphosphate carboxylase small subunit [Merismopedia sp. SIO2A8]